MNSIPVPRKWDHVSILKSDNHSKIVSVQDTFEFKVLEKSKVERNRCTYCYYTISVKQDICDIFNKS